MDLHPAAPKPLRTTGFTLTEILVVTGIIGILAGIAIPSMLRVRHEARIQVANNDIRVISAAIQILAFDTGQWPGGLPAGTVGNPESWDLNTNSAGLVRKDSRFFNWKGPYMDHVQLDPWGQPYFFDPDYRINYTWTPVVGSFGPNRKGRNFYDDDNIFEAFARVK